MDTAKTSLLSDKAMQKGHYVTAFLRKYGRKEMAKLDFSSFRERVLAEIKLPTSKSSDGL